MQLVGLDRARAVLGEGRGVARRGGREPRLDILFDGVGDSADVLEDGVRLDPAGVDQVGQVVCGVLVGGVRVPLDGGEVERGRAIEGGPLEDVEHAVQDLVDRSATVLLTGRTVVLADVDVDRDGIV